MGSGPNSTPPLNRENGTTGTRQKKNLSRNLRARLIWKIFMKNSNCLVSMGDIGFRLPGLVVRIVTDPIHQVKQLAPENLGAEDLVNLELRKTVHLSGQGRRHDTARERVRHMRLQKADVEHGMDFHRRWQAESKCRIPDRANDGEGPETADIQFGRRTRGGNVPAEEPHMLPSNKIWSWPAAPIRGELHRFPSF